MAIPTFEFAVYLNVSTVFASCQESNAIFAHDTNAIFAHDCAHSIEKLKTAH